MSWGYTLLTAAVLLAPYLSSHPARTASQNNRLITIGLLLGALLLTLLRPGIPPILALCLLIPFVRTSTWTVIGGLTALLLFLPSIWWISSSQLSASTVIAFLLLTLLASRVQALQSPQKPAGEAQSSQSRMLPLMMACAAAGLATGLITEGFGTSSTIHRVWHHWGAYLAPVEAWLAGGAPYRDFPIQYGLGPTSVLAVSCISDCWKGMYATVVVANALYFASLSGCVFALIKRRCPDIGWLAILALFCATFLWTGYGAEYAGSITTPSVAGLRFLPISLLLLHILTAEQRSAPRDWVGHLLWLLDLFWSPEAAFFGTLLWWPYLALRDLRESSVRARLTAMWRGAVRGGLATVCGLGAVALVVWLLSGRTATPGDFFIYIQHPPGRLPVNPLGPIWLAMASVFLAMKVLATQPPSPEQRALYCCLLALTGAGAYFLSRSHDNNILNLFPFLTLLLIALAPHSENHEGLGLEFVNGFIRLTLSAIVAFVAMFNFMPWKDGMLDNRFDIGPSSLIARFSPEPSDQPALLSQEAVVGIQYLRGIGAKSILLLDDRAVMLIDRPGAGWTGVNNVANFGILPTDAVGTYIQRGAQTYRRPGWILADRSAFSHWVQMFAAVYEVQELKRFGSYAAYRVVPKSDQGARH